MTCEKYFASQHCHLPEINIENAVVKTTWSNIWNSTLRNCCSHALQDVSFQLLEVIVKVCYVCCFASFFVVVMLFVMIVLI